MGILLKLVLRMVTQNRLELHIETAPRSITAYGELDYENCHELESAIMRELSCCDGRVDLALAGLDFVDSSGVKTLIVGAQDAHSLGCVLRVVSLTTQLDRALTMAGVRHLLEIGAEPVRPIGSGVRMPPTDEMVFSIPADTKSCCDGRDKVCEFAESIGFEPPIIDDIKLAAGEALSNAVRHGACRGKSIKVRCSRIEEDGVCINLRYESHEFDPAAVPIPDLADPPIGGMGIHFMRLVMDKVHYYFEDGCAILTLEKRGAGAPVIGGE